MDTFMKFILYVLIISSEIDYLLSRPVTSLRRLKRLRERRQVVQPKWLTNHDFTFINPNVRITEKSLKEAAAIRESIQSAVDAGTFAVSVGQTDSPISVIETSDSDANQPQPPSTPRTPMFPNFDFMQIDFSNFEFFNANQRAAWTSDIRNAWEEIIENSKRVFNIHT